MNKKVHNAFALFFLIFLGISASFCVYSALTSARAHVISGYDKWMKNRKVKVTQPKKKIKSPYGEKLPKKPPVVQPKKERYSKHDSKLAQSYGAVTKLMIPDQKKVERWIVDSFPFRDEFSNFNMAFKYHLNMKRPLEAKDSPMILPNHQLSQLYSVAPEVQKGRLKILLEYKKLCESEKIPFFVVYRPFSIGFHQDLYEPYKGLQVPFNRNCALRAAHLRENGITTFELYKEMRKVIPEEKWQKYFYQSDHHWNVDGALVGSRLIADFMNRNYGTSFDLKYFDPDTYIRKRWKDLFIGSMGKKVSTSYMPDGPDDFDILYPRFKTDFTVKIPKYKYRVRKDFSAFIFGEHIFYDGYHKNPYCGFLEGNQNCWITNHKIKNGKKIVVIKDSFTRAMIPYLALQAKEIIMLDPRHCTQKEILKTIRREKPDIVFVMHVQLM